MGVESITPASTISSLVPGWPTGTELKSQGDDHIRNIKQTLVQTFPNATRPFPIASVVGFAASGSITAAQENALIFVSSGTQVNLSLPTLAPSQAGWSAHIIQQSAGPLFVFPPSGTLVSGESSVAYARRCIVNVPFKVFWTGAQWFVDRVNRVPVGTILPCFRSTPPLGWAFCNGQTLPPSLFPEYAAVVHSSGVTLNLCERVLCAGSGGAMGAAINAIHPSRSGMDPTSWYSVGGQDAFGLDIQQIPAHVHIMRSSNHGATGFLAVTNHELAHNHGGTTTGGANLPHTHDPSSPATTIMHSGPATVQSGSGPGIAGLATTGGVTGGGATLSHDHTIGSELGSTAHTVTGFTQYTGGTGSSALGSSADHAPQAVMITQNMQPTIFVPYMIAVE